MQKDNQSMYQESYPLLIHKTRYLIDSETAGLLKEGIIPEQLKKRITQTQGSEFCFEFCRQRRLMKRICDQIDAGSQPESIRTLVESGNVPAEILYKLYHHKLLGKAEKLLKANLLSKDVVETIRTHVLTEEIINPLSRAFLMEMARYLYEHHEINHETLHGIENGTIDPIYIQIIRRHYRHMTHLEELQGKHAITKLDGMPEPSAEDPHLDSALTRQEHLSALKEALLWLNETDADLIRRIYFEETPITKIAKDYGVVESTIRYRRDRILEKLRLIFEEVLHYPKESIFF